MQSKDHSDVIKYGGMLEGNALSNKVIEEINKKEIKSVVVAQININDTFLLHGLKFKVNYIHGTKNRISAELIIKE